MSLRKRLLSQVVFSLAIGFGVLAPDPACAQSYMFMDEAGNIYHVDALHKVPKKYREQVIPEEPEPELTKKQYTKLQRELERRKKKAEREEKRKQEDLEKARKKKLKKLEKERKKERLREQKENRRENSDRDKVSRRGLSDLAPPSDILLTDEDGDTSSEQVEANETTE